MRKPKYITALRTVVRGMKERNLFHVSGLGPALFLWAELSRMWWDALRFLSFSFTSYLNSGRG